MTNTITMKILNTARLTKMWPTDRKWADAVGKKKKMEPMDLLDAGLPQTFKLKKQTKKQKMQYLWNGIKLGMPALRVMEVPLLLSKDVLPQNNAWSVASRRMSCLNIREKEGLEHGRPDASLFFSPATCSLHPLKEVASSSIQRLLPPSSFFLVFPTG